MGCDIHIYLEYNRNEEVSGIKWESADVFDYKGNQVPIYIGRDYVLFSILADVRNNIKNYCIAPISKPKGLPDDLSNYVIDEYKKHLERYIIHSCSYYTLRELYESINDDIIFTLSDTFTFFERKSLIGKLIENIEKQIIRMYIYESGHNIFSKEIVKKKSDYIRIVFWFDN
jgi:hypothetical protein